MATAISICPEFEKIDPANVGCRSAVALLVAGPDQGSVPGRVLDGSRSGLRLSVNRPFAEGTVLRVRALDAADEIPWLQVQVKWTRTKGHQWELGCKFEERLSWNTVLEFFG